MRTISKALCVALPMILAAAAPAWAINKCTGADGKVTFQDAPCAGNGGQIDVRPASGPARAVVPAAAPLPPPAVASAAASPPPAPATPAQPEPAPGKSLLTRQADECLAWYRPKLRDPASAYYSAPSKDGRTLTMTIHATNGYGGFVTTSGVCEFNGGKLDQGWTEIYAKRAGW